jgi:hypothetical protein
MTDRPILEFSRSKRLALRFAVLVVAVSALGVAYSFTRPPELVWWTSPSIRETTRRLRVLIPNGWKASWERVLDSAPGGDWLYTARFTPVDNRPTWLRRMFKVKLEDEALLAASFERNGTEKEFTYEADGLRQRVFNGATVYTVVRRMQAGVPPLHAIVYYGRENLPAFNRTYRQICNSLTIE